MPPAYERSLDPPELELLSFETVQQCRSKSWAAPSHLSCLKAYLLQSTDGPPTHMNNLFREDIEKKATTNMLEDFSGTFVLRIILFFSRLFFPENISAEIIFGK